MFTGLPQPLLVVSVTGFTVALSMSMETCPWMHSPCHGLSMHS